MLVDSSSKTGKKCLALIMAKQPTYPIVEFSNNGIIDLLSGAPSQNAFMKSLHQALANADRSKSDLTLVTIKIVGEQYKSSGELEIALIDLAKLIRKNLRAGDLFTRMSERGYWLLIHGDKLAGMKIAERLRANATSTTDIQIHMREESTNLASWVSEVDGGYFN
jgi:GGDEF domain-containing protein